MSETMTVQTGQIWADNDARCEGRTVRVDSVDDTYAYCTILTNSNDQQLDLDHHAARSQSRDRRGRPTRIMLARMRPTPTGYRLLSDAPKEG